MTPAKAKQRKVALSARVSPVVKAGVEAAGKLPGSNQSRVVEDALRKYLRLGEVGQAATAGADSSAIATVSSPPAASPRVDLADWLGRKTGAPRALMAARIRAGRVKVDGLVQLEQYVDRDDRAHRVELDGLLVEAAEDVAKEALDAV